MIHTESLSKDTSFDDKNQNHASQSSTAKTIIAVRFWTDQLKNAILVRYGKLGNNAHIVRQLLLHTKQVLRQKDGLDRAINKFI
jgi:hypothetical protein